MYVQGLFGDYWNILCLTPYNKNKLMEFTWIQPESYESTMPNRIPEMLIFCPVTVLGTLVHVHVCTLKQIRITK